MKLDKLFLWKEPPELDFSLPTINFDVRAGEIVAIAGIEGNGQSELVKYISGNKKAPSGTIIFKCARKLRDLLLSFLRKAKKAPPDGDLEFKYSKYDISKKKESISYQNEYGTKVSLWRLLILLSRSAKKSSNGTITFNYSKKRQPLIKRKIVRYKNEEGVDVSFDSIGKRLKGGMSLVPEDRHKDGLFLDDSVSFNTVCN